METDMFEKASRVRLRFESSKGLLSAEDLWDLPLTSAKGQANLNDIAKGLFRELRESEEISFVETPTKKNEAAQLRLDIVKHVIAARIVERDAKAVEIDRAQKKQKIMGILAQKEDEALASTSAEELRKMLESL